MTSSDPLTGRRWAAPGRVNLIGEHTDHNDGWVLPIAIDRQAVVTLTEISSDSDDTPSSYVEGVLWALRADSYDVPRLRVELTSDVPIGAGLSSSAALTCATALAVNDAYGLGLTREQLVDVAQRAENDFVGAPTGMLDQSASLLCTADHALLLDCRSREARQVPLDLGDLHLLVVDSKVSHQLSDGGHEGGYGQRRRECVEAARLLGVDTLRDVPDDADLSALPDVPRRRARHVLTENRRVLDAVALLDRGDVAGLGDLLTASHASLRDDFEVSVPELDTLVETALWTGALGARMVGGGFGGSMVVLTADPERLTAAVTDLRPEVDVFEVSPAQGAREL